MFATKYIIIHIPQNFFRDILISHISMAIAGTDLLEVPTIYKAYFLGLCKGISPQNMA
jgi:hypothetical protein